MTAREQRVEVVATHAPSGRRTGALTWMLPPGLSLALHIGALVAAVSVIGVVRTAREEREPVVVSFLDPGPAPAVTIPEQSGGAQKADVSGQSSRGEPQPLVREPAQGGTESSLAALLREPSSRDAGALLRQEIAERDELMKERRFPDVQFAGVGASNARSIVYVVDASGSMVSSLPVVVKELKESIRKLAPTQQFQVVFFRNNRYSAAPHPADRASKLTITRLIRATEENVTSVCEWIDTMTAAGRSNPIPALEVALSLEPDAVFVLSSVITGAGVWEPNRDELLAKLDQLNPRDRRTGRRRVVINTIQFLDEDPSEILRAIADEHGNEGGRGAYRFISRRELGLESGPEAGSGRP